MKAVASLKLFIAGALCTAAVFAHAQSTTYHVSWDLGVLALPSGYFGTDQMYLDMQLTDGTNTGAGNSTVDITNLNLTGGSFNSVLPDIGNVTYPTANSVLLSDGPGPANALADHAVGFMPMSTTDILSFDFTVNATGYDTPPDDFNVALLFPDLTTVATLGPTQREFIDYQFTDAAATPVVYGVDPGFAAYYAGLGDSRLLSLQPPTVLAVPEPCPMGAGAIAACLVGLSRRRRRA